MDYNLQISHKTQLIQTALSHLFPESQINMTPAMPIWAYRQHITLTIRNNYSRLYLGYIGLDNESLVEIRECPIFTMKMTSSSQNAPNSSLN